MVVAQVERYGRPLARGEIVLALPRRECHVLSVRAREGHGQGERAERAERAERERGGAPDPHPHCITLPLPYRTYIWTPNTARAAANSHLLTSVSSTSRSISPPISAYISLSVRASTDLK